MRNPSQAGAWPAPPAKPAMAKRVRKELEQALADSDITGIQIRPVDASHMHFEASIQGEFLLLLVVWPHFVLCEFLCFHRGIQ